MISWSTSYVGGHLQYDDDVDHVGGRIRPCDDRDDKTYHSRSVRNEVVQNRYRAHVHESMSLEISVSEV